MKAVDFRCGFRPEHFVRHAARAQTVLPVATYTSDSKGSNGTVKMRTLILPGGEQFLRRPDTRTSIGGLLVHRKNTFLDGLQNAAICMISAHAAREHSPYEERLASNGQASTSSVHVIDSRPPPGRPSIASLYLSAAPAGT